MTSDLEKVAKSDTNISVGNSHSLHERHLVSKKVIWKAEGRSYTTDWVRAARSQIENRDMLESLVLRIIEQRCYVMAQNSSK